MAAAKKSVRGPAGAKVPTPTHTGALHFRTCPTLSPFVLDLMRTERAHFYPQHWLLCQMGLYWFKFKFKGGHTGHGSAVAGL